MTRRTVCAAALFALAAGCGSASSTVRNRTADDAVVTFACEVADAEVWINDRRIGLVGDLPAGVALTPSKVHRLEVRHDDYHSHYAELELAARERRVLTIELAARLP